ncbi:MAG: hypothetical protein C4576_20410 [Desulfobacteraceae bacterium]|nr:MAG: hypothetical protein C4576_20410 [Desulfobacteraceae bacterium]
MLSKEKQIRNAGLYLLPVIAANLFPLLTLPIFTRILSKEDFGVWSLSLVYATFANGIANFGLTVGYERNFFEYKEPYRVAGLLYSTLLFVIFSFTVGAVLTRIYSPPLSAWIIGSPDEADVLFWSYCAVGVMGMKTYFLTYFKNTGNAKAFVWYTLDESILGVILSLFMVAYLRIGLIGLIWSQLLASSIVFSVITYKFLRFLPPCFDLAALRDSLKLSLPLTPRIFFGVIGSQFDKYMLGLLNTVGGVGVYTIGQKMANLVFTFMTAIQNVFAPQVYRYMFEGGEDGGKLVGRYLTPFLYFSISVALVISLFSEEIVKLVAPRSYDDAIDVVTILPMLYGTYFFGKQPQLIFAKKTYLTSLLTLFSISINIAMNIPFIIRWGAIGAAWGTLLAGLISGGVSFWFSQHYYRISWEYGKIGWIFLIFFGSSTILIGLRHFGVSYEVRFLLKIIPISCYFFLGIQYKFVSKQNIALLWKAVFPVKAEA